MGLLDWVPAGGITSLRNLFGHNHRRIWQTHNRAHIELKSLDPVDMTVYAETLVEQLEAHPGVVWAEVNAILGRVIVSYDPTVCTSEDLVALVDRVDERFFLTEEAFGEDCPEHPGDTEPIVRTVVRLVADVLGVGLGTALDLVRKEPSESGYDIAALMSMVENVPHLRGRLARRVGDEVADVGLGVLNAFVQAIGSGPIAPLVDIPYQLVQLAEARARRSVWHLREQDLCTDPEHARAAPLRRYKRPAPVPAGPIERYADEAWQISLGGFAVGLADTQDFKRAVTPILDALPKPARYGREAYCARLGRSLATRGILNVDAGVLRRLDRVDLVIVDDGLLYTDDLHLERVETIDDELDAYDAYHQARLLFDPTAPFETRRGGEWALGLLKNLPAHKATPQLRAELEERVASLSRVHFRSGPALALTHRDRVVALVRTSHAVDPAAEPLVAAIRRADLHFILIGEAGTPGHDFKPDRYARRGRELVRLIRQEQRANHVVLMIGRGDSPALAAADVSLGIVRPGEAPPWSADLIAVGELDDAAYLVDACREARRISEQSVMLAGTGAGIGAFYAIGGLKKVPPGRITLAVNAASLIALGNGIRAAAMLERRVKPVRRDATPWHSMPAEAVLEKLGSSLEGLTIERALARQRPPEKPTPITLAVAQAVARELANPLTPVLAVGAAISAIVGSVTDAGIVASVIGVNGLIGGIERYNAEQVIANLARRETCCVEVVRDGQTLDIDSDRLVPGDVIRLEAGDVVPADCRILEAELLEVDESALTGESLPVPKSAQVTFASAVADRTSMLYEGTSISVGEVRAVIVATGDDTEMRRAIHRPGHHPRTESGVEARLQQLTDLTFPFATSSGAMLMAIGMFRRQKLDELVGPAVNLAVAAVPEGLPLLSTAAQLSAARRLSDRGVLVRNPRAMEALGRVDVVCADKTGTLTEGIIRLHSVFDGASTRPMGEFEPSHCAIVAAAMRATPEEPDEGLLPHATDRAIVDGGRDANVSVALGHDAWERLEELPFKPDRHYHAVLGRTGEGLVVTIKGAPEEVIARCTTRMHGSKPRRLDARGRKRLLGQIEELAGQGLRVLAIAERAVGSGDEEPFEEDDVQKLTLLGFVALSDPLRKTSAEAVELLHASGVEVIMITGDHASTAARIAADVGLAHGGGVLIGAEIDAMDDETLDHAIDQVRIIARATPHHKVRIVEALQRKGRVVAMTGDGGNDAPAIRLADVGIALGRYATSAARESADLVVTDERIETIVDAIVEGRAMWSSVRDAVSILIGGNLGEVGFMLGSGVLSRTPALNARQLLLVNLFTDVAPAMAIALRPPSHVSPETLMHEGPEASLGHALDRDIVWRAIMTGAAGLGAWGFARLFFMKRAAPTVGLLAIVGAQLGQTLVTGRPNATVLAACLGSAAGLLAIVQTPGLSQALGCRPLGPRGLLTAATATAVATAASLVAPRIAERLETYLEDRNDRACYEPASSATDEDLPDILDGMDMQVPM